MKAVQNVLLFLILLIGFGTIYYHQEVIDFYNEYYGEPDTRQIIGYMIQPSGEVRHRRPKRLIYKKAKDQFPLRYYDTIQTGPEASVTLKFSSGLEILIEANTLIVLEEPAIGGTGEVLLSFLNGNYKVLKGNAGNLSVRKKKNRAFDPFGKNILNPMVVKKEEAQEEIPPPPPIKPTKPKVKQQAKKIKKDFKQKNIEKRIAKETLSDEYISNVIKKQRPFFNRCFVQHLRLNPNASGKVDFSFKILPTGKVEKIRVLRSTIKDPRFQQCTLSVVRRANFKSYKGDPIIVNYPINFE